MNVLSLCDRTGNMIRPFAEAGHFCVFVDLQHPKGTSRVWEPYNVRRVGANVLSFQWSDGWDFFDIVIAQPTCRDLAGSGARWWAQKGEKAYHEAMHLVFRCRDIAEESGGKWWLENPVGRIPKAWREWDYIFDPCDYGGYLDPPGDAYTKRTCLWTGGGFVMPEPKPVKPVPQSENPIHQASPGPERSDMRSVTPMGFARAVFEANRGSR